jgi:hypothetical protein
MVSKSSRLIELSAAQPLSRRAWRATEGGSLHTEPGPLSGRPVSTVDSDGSICDMNGCSGAVIAFGGSRSFCTLATEGSRGGVSALDAADLAVYKGLVGVVNE